MDYEQTQNEALRAKQLLEDELVKRILKDLRQGIIDEWVSSPIRDVEGQHELRLLLKASDMFENMLIAKIEAEIIATDARTRNQAAL